MRVLLFDVHLSVQRHLEELAGKIHTQRMPLICGDRCIGVLDSVALAASSVVKGNVVLERVSPSHIVVIAILETPHHTTCAILPPFHWLELHLDEPVGQRYGFSDAPGKGALARLHQYIRLARRSWVRVNRPARRAATGDAAVPCGRDRAERIVVKANGACKCDVCD